MPLHIRFHTLRYPSGSPHYPCAETDELILEDAARHLTIRQIESLCLITVALPLTCAGDRLLGLDKEARSRRLLC